MSPTTRFRILTSLAGYDGAATHVRALLMNGADLSTLTTVHLTITPPERWVAVHHKLLRWAKREIAGSYSWIGTSPSLFIFLFSADDVARLRRWVEHEII